MVNILEYEHVNAIWVMVPIYREDLLVYRKNRIQTAAQAYWKNVWKSIGSDN